MAAERLRALVADDHPVFRSGLRTTLSATQGVEVVGEAATGLQAVALARQLRPDLVVMDLRMPELNGVEATRRILEHDPTVAVLVLTMLDDDDSVFAALQAGARGYLLKGADHDDVTRAEMGNRRPGQVLVTLGLVAVVCFGLSAVLDEHGNWGDPRQAAANVLWILFVLSTLAFLVVAVRFALVRRKQRA